MDLGLGEILRHFEEHFGKLATKGLLLIIGFAVVGVCFTVIWEKILVPLYKEAYDWVIVNGHFQLPSVNTVISGIIAGAIAFVIFTFLVAIGLKAMEMQSESVQLAVEANRKELEKLQKSLEDYQQQLENTQKESIRITNELDVAEERAKNIHGLSEDVINAIKENMKKRIKEDFPPSSSTPEKP